MNNIIKLLVFSASVLMLQFAMSIPAHAGQKHLFYFNGINVDNFEGDYDEIVRALKGGGFDVIYEPRYDDSMSVIDTEVQKTAQQVKDLLAAGTPPEDITISGFSFGSVIAMFAALAIDNPKINYVLISGCPGPGARHFDIDYANIHGRVLSIYDKWDDTFNSCGNKLTGATEYKEILVDVGGHAGFRFGAPDVINIWKEPLEKWARHQ